MVPRPVSPVNPSLTVDLSSLLTSSRSCPVPQVPRPSRRFSTLPKFSPSGTNPRGPKSERLPSKGGTFPTLTGSKSCSSRSNADVSSRSALFLFCLSCLNCSTHSLLSFLDRTGCCCQGQEVCLNSPLLALLLVFFPPTPFSLSPFPRQPPQPNLRPRPLKPSRPILRHDRPAGVKQVNRLTRED